MMITIRKLLAVLVSLIFLKVSAQDIKIGEMCPDVAIEKIVHFSKSSANISDFKGKLLILDFWATWCQPCVAMFPRTDSLQKKFGDAIQFLPVSDENEKTVSDFLDKMKNVRRISPPSVVGDHILNGHFLHTGIPHYVWIDPKGMVSAITGSDEITAENIKSALAGHQVVAAAEEFPTMEWDSQKPAFTANSVFKDEHGKRHEVVIDPSQILLHSVLTKSRPGMVATAYDDSDRITCLEIPLPSLYRIAVGHFAGKYLISNRTSWEVSNPELSVYSDSACRGNGNKTEKENNDYEKKYSFCYEIQFPAGLTVPKKYEYMLNDLNRYFGTLYGIQGKLEDRKVNCLKLIRTTTEDKMATKGAAHAAKNNSFSFNMFDTHFSEFVGTLRLFLQALPPLVDETNYTGNVDLQMTADFRNVDSINQALKKYGLKIVPAVESIPMVVITDKK